MRGLGFGADFWNFRHLIDWGHLLEDKIPNDAQPNGGDRGNQNGGHKLKFIVAFGISTTHSIFS